VTQGSAAGGLRGVRNASVHDEIDAAHERAHEQGFSSEAEHEGYHRAMRQAHRVFGLCRPRALSGPADAV
jgi:hypothetical protein